MAWLALLLVFTVLEGCSAHNNGLALTPPMGFLSWERFRCNTDCKNDPNNCVGENLYKQMADVIASEGYKDVGYEYIGIDDCWLSKTRDAQGNLQTDPDRFPNGILGLARYVHSKGLKLGIYEDSGTLTCKRYPGSDGHIEQDAKTFASWEVDLLKFDGCYGNPEMKAKNFPLMSESLNRTGRPILFTCEWGLGIPAPQSHYIRNAKYCNTWRTYEDIENSWATVSKTIEFYAQNAGNFSDVSAPGAINDPDELIIGDYSLSYDQERVQFAMWAMFSGSLFTSADLRNMRPQAKAILQNKGVIAINQDPLVKGGFLYKIVNKVQVWHKVLSGPVGTRAVAFYYPVPEPYPTYLSTTFSDIGLNNVNGYNVTEVFDNINMGVFKPTSPFKIQVNPTGVYLVKATAL